MDIRRQRQRACGEHGNQHRARNLRREPGRSASFRYDSCHPGRSGQAYKFLRQIGRPYHHGTPIALSDQWSADPASAEDLSAPANRQLSLRYSLGGQPTIDSKPAGWIEPFSKPITLSRVHRVMDIASAQPTFRSPRRVTSQDKNPRLRAAGFFIRKPRGRRRGRLRQLKLSSLNSGAKLLSSWPEVAVVRLTKSKILPSCSP